MDVRDNESDGRSPRWDISQERAFIETLLGQRFNFLLVFFSIIVAGAVNARDVPFMQAAVLSLGAVITYYLASAIGRSQEKLDLILGIIFKEQRTHPATVADQLASRNGSRRKVIGYTIPRICFWVLTVWAVIAWTISAVPWLGDPRGQ